MEKRINICTTFYDVEDWKDSFEDYLKANDLNENEVDIYEFIEETLAIYIKDEIINLNRECGDILAIADLDLWNGHRSAYQIIKKGKLNGIFDINKYDDFEYYYDKDNVCADIYHHDGCNHIIFREIKKGVNPQPLLDAIYNQEEVTEEMIKKYTKSLVKCVKKCYGL